MNQAPGRLIPKTDPISQPFFSVIITTYNRSGFIERALNSLINQIEPDWEAVIIDDGSTDDTYLKLLPYLHSFKKIAYRKIMHGGESMAKNEGIKLSSGRFITFLDSDDEYRPDHLKSRKKLLIHHSEVEFLHGGVTIIGNQFVPDRFNPEEMIPLTACVIGGTFFIKQQLLISLTGFKHIVLGPDADLFDRAVESGSKIIKTDLPTYIYHRESNDSITSNYGSSVHKL